MRLLLLGLAGLVPALALAEPISFSIPAEPAGQALLDFSRQSGRQVLFSPDDLKGVTANPVRGWFEPADALFTLLDGTHFIAQPNGRGTFVITAAPAPRVTPPPAFEAPPANGNPAATQMAPYTVNGRADPGTAPIDAQSVPLGNLDLPRSENDALPYLVYTREDIERSGQTSIDDFLRQEVLQSDPTPGLGQGGLNSYGQNAAYFNGSTNVNLRAFGEDETLVLLNGLPLPTVLSGYGEGGAITERQADVDLIPVNLVERVEVLPVSSAALYSGSPVGGVINIVLRPAENIDEISAAYTNGFRIHGPTAYLSLLHGQTLLGGKLSYRFDLSVNRAAPPSERELGYIERNLAEHPTLEDPPDTPLYRATPNIASPSTPTMPGTPLFGPGTPTFTSVAPGADGSGGLAAFAGREGEPSLGLFRAPGGMASSTDSSDYAYGVKETSTSFFGTVTYSPFPALQLGVQGLYSYQINEPGYDLFRGNLTLAANNPLNPFGAAVNVSLDEDAPLLGQGYDQAQLDLYSGVAGLLLKLPGGWRVSGDIEYSHSLTDYRGVAGVDDNAWQNLVDTGQYNPLRDTEVYGPPPAFYQQALIYFGRPGKYLNLDNYQVADGALRIMQPSLTLPTGPAALNFGVDYNLQYQASFNDDQYYGDGQLAPTSGYWTGRTLQQFSAAAEGQASLLPPAWRPRWLRDLRVDAAGRYNAAKAGYGTGIAPTFGLKAELAGGLSLRASVANTNRFPTATTARFVPVVGGTGTGPAGPVTSETILDPLRGNAVEQVTSSDIPNAQLVPEADVTQSAGVVYETGTRQKLRLSADWFQTRKSGELDYLDAQDVVDYEAYLPGRVTRAPPSLGDPYAAGPVTNVLTGNINLAWQHSENWDFALDYALKDVAGGTLGVYARYVYFQRFDVEVVPHAAVVDELRSPDTASLDLVPHRVNLGAGWENERFGFGIEDRYFSRRTIPELQQALQGSDHIASYSPIDVYVKGNLHLWDRKAARVPRLGAELRVSNVFDAALPKFPTSPDGTGVEAYGDWRGQVYSVSFTLSY